ncbi:GNAT family N-acetyltransferase [Aliikangiella sp. G2MR2-5]|uniref:GNAT family N-acetyltransferase n=1 Tax=Aliikangiella sp. G2MR2-5 TaxID=2788943 RepID=UPI001AEDACF3|nr:GNAT family N-acetyltransferase [Aliikangiella sp. G2MR2-5]
MTSIQQASPTNSILLKLAESPEEIESAARLFREYQQFLKVDLCFQSFEQELATLPGKYAAPDGAIYLAYYQGKAVGCVAVRPIKDDICEMKRLYVKPEVQGLAIGRKLATLVIEKAKRIGYKRMQLDTLERLQAALSLYESLGFKRIDSYYENPLPEVVFMELKL